MKLLYRVMVWLLDDEGNENLRVWYEHGNSADKIRDNIVKIMDHTLVNYREIEVKLGA